MSAIKEPFKIIASSQDNFIVFDNPHNVQDTYAQFFVLESEGEVLLEIRDTSNTNVVYRISGSPDAPISAVSFNTSGTVENVRLALLETLTQYPNLLFNVRIEGGAVVVGLSNNTRYEITTSDATVVAVGGNYTDNPIEDDYSVRVSARWEDKTIRLEKTTSDDMVSFNLSSIFHYSTSKYPHLLNVSASDRFRNVCNPIPLRNADFVVLPTTLRKFKPMDYFNFYYQEANRERVSFLTSKHRRKYDYGEKIALSVLSDTNNVDLVKFYYSPSGMFLAKRVGCVRREYTNNRIDFYDDLKIEEEEQQAKRSVGFVDVWVYSEGQPIVENPVVFHVEHKCEDFHTVFFVNELGGLDSYSFRDKRAVSSSIDEQSNYVVNNVDYFDRSYEFEHTNTKKMDATVTLSARCDMETAEWLRELQQSKWVWIDRGDNELLIVTDEFNIDTNTDDKFYDLTFSYHEGDTILHY